MSRGASPIRWSSSRGSQRMMFAGVLPTASPGSHRLPMIGSTRDPTVHPSKTQSWLDSRRFGRPRIFFLCKRPLHTSSLTHERTPRSSQGVPIGSTGAKPESLRESFSIRSFSISRPTNSFRSKSATSSRKSMLVSDTTRHSGQPNRRTPYLSSPP